MQRWRSRDEEAECWDGGAAVRATQGSIAGALTSLIPERKVPAHTPRVVMPGRGSQAGPISAALLQAPFSTFLFLSVLSGVTGGIQ